MVVSWCKFLSNLVFKSLPFVIRMGDTTFRATWDDTGNVGVVNLTKAELEEFTASIGAGKGELITSTFQNSTFFIGIVLSGVGREIQMETDDLAFKLRMRFDVSCMASEESRVPQIKKDLIVLYHRSMCHISA